MAKKRDIDNAKLEEMISNPAIAALYESFDLGNPVAEEKEAKRAELREKIREKMTNKLRESDDDDVEMDLEDDADLEFSEDDFLDDDAEMDFDDEDFLGDEEGEDEPGSVQAAIDTAQSALDDIENFVADETVDEVMDEEYGDDELLDDDIFIEDEDEYELEDDDEMGLEERKKEIRAKIQEALRRRRLAEKKKKASKEEDEDEKESKKKKKVKELRASLFKGRETLKAIQEKRADVYSKVRKSLKENGKNHDYTQKGIKVHNNLKVQEAKLREALDVIRAEIREALFSTGGPAPGAQVKFPGMPKKTQTGIQKQKNTKTEYPKKAKGTQKGHNWPTHGSASDKKGESVKKAGKFPGQAISRMNEAKKRVAIRRRIREALAKRDQ